MNPDKLSRQPLPIVVLALIILFVRDVLIKTTTWIINALLLPGIVALYGLRLIVADMVHTKVETMAIFSKVGGEPALPAGAGRWARVAVLLVPHVLLFIIGTLLLAPLFVRFAALGVQPLPQLHAEPQAMLSGDAGWRILGDIFVSNSTLTFLKLWTGLACWYVSAPGYKLVADSRRLLQEISRENKNGRRAAHRLRQALAPVAFGLRVLAIFDEAMLWLGGNMLLATGGVTVLILSLAAFLLSRAFFL